MIQSLYRVGVGGTVSAERHDIKISNYQSYRNSGGRSFTTAKRRQTTWTTLKWIESGVMYCWRAEGATLPIIGACWCQRWQLWRSPFSSLFRRLPSAGRNVLVLFCAGAFLNPATALLCSYLLPLECSAGAARGDDIYDSERRRGYVLSKMAGLITYVLFVS